MSYSKKQMPNKQEPSLKKMSVGLNSHHPLAYLDNEERNKTRVHVIAAVVAQVGRERRISASIAEGEILR